MRSFRFIPGWAAASRELQFRFLERIIIAKFFIASSTIPIFFANNKEEARMEVIYGTDGAKALNFSDLHVSSTTDDDSSVLLTNTNKLLQAVGISAKRIESTDELSRVASSLFVAVYESLFHQRINGIVRYPRTKDDYERNAQLVINCLSDQIQLDLKHITGRSIVSGDLRVLSNLVHILVRIVSLTRYCSHFVVFHLKLDHVNIF